MKRLKYYWEGSPKQLRAMAKFMRVVAVIVLILDILVYFLSIPFGIVMSLVVVYSFWLANSYVKVAIQKEKGTFVAPQPAKLKEKKYLKSYVIFDTETTGLNPRSDRIIEIAAVKVENGQIVDTYSSLINPGKNITKRITDINGITNEMVIDAPFEDTVIPEFCNFCTGYVLMAYNLQFDINFVSAALNRIGLSYNFKHTIDILKITRGLYDLQNYKLETVMQDIDPNYVQSHRALDDCMACKQIMDDFDIAYNIFTKTFNITFTDRVRLEELSKAKSGQA